MAGSISNSNPSRLGGGLPGGQPKGGLLGGGGGTSGGSGMVGGSERGRDRKLLRKAFGRFSVKKSLFGEDPDDDGILGDPDLASGGAITQMSHEILDEDHLHDEYLLHDEGSMQAQATNRVHKFPLTPFRQAFNAGDSEGTVNNTVLEHLYAPNQVGGTGAGQLIYDRAGGAHKGGGAAYTGNPKYVYDSSDYIRFKKLQAKNRTYNDKSFGGANNGAYVPLMRVRRGF
tara:strand:- start:530 stop:1216 length:687 start_codon:yes stop_codon:yes gene_type:complete